MNKYFKIEIPRKKFQTSWDMLRYDNAFQVNVKENTVEIFSLNFTPERWKSFGVEIDYAISFKCSQTQANEYSTKAVGFWNGFLTGFECPR